MSSQRLDQKQKQIPLTTITKILATLTTRLVKLNQDMCYWLMDILLKVCCVQLKYTMGITSGFWANTCKEIQ